MDCGQLSIIWIISGIFMSSYWCSRADQPLDLRRPDQLRQSPKTFLLWESDDSAGRITA